ncbi:MAG TPA: sulfurtransferase, partial [Actinomycetota bacterium]|nr:sulfurtransferase [Actinomycetota bacterium]
MTRPREALLRLPGPLVEAAWVARHLEHPDLVVADVRWDPDGSAHRRYEEGHLPGAVFVDVDRDLSAPRSPGSGRHPLPAPEDFAAAMARLGIGDGTAVVAYDDAGGAYAARLWWMLRVTGHEAAVLDGGLAAWAGPLEAGPGRPRPPATFAPRPWPEELLARAEDVERARGDPGSVILDARAPERYRGEVEPIDPVAGHIPGARNAPFPGNLDPATGRFLPPEELRRRFEALGAGRGRDVIVYCGSGVTSCHLLLAMELAG